MVHQQTGQIIASGDPLKLTKTQKKNARGKARKKHAYERTELLKREVQRLLDLQPEQQVSMAQQGVTNTQEDLSGNRSSSKGRACFSDLNDNNASSPCFHSSGDLRGGSSDRPDPVHIQRARGSGLVMQASMDRTGGHGGGRGHQGLNEHMAVPDQRHFDSLNGDGGCLGYNNRMCAPDPHQAYRLRLGDRGSHPPSAIVPHTGFVGTQLAVMGGRDGGSRGAGSTEATCHVGFVDLYDSDTLGHGMGSRLSIDIQHTGNDGLHIRDMMIGIGGGDGGRVRLGLNIHGGFSVLNQTVVLRDASGGRLTTDISITRNAGLQVPALMGRVCGGYHFL